MALSFLLRASLVIGTLSYLAAQGGGSAPHPPGEVAPRLSAALADPVAAIPQGTRERVAREALTELVRRAGQTVPAVAGPASRDTLLASDRAPPWRGGPDLGAAR